MAFVCDAKRESLWAFLNGAIKALCCQMDNVYPSAGLPIQVSFRFEDRKSRDLACFKPTTNISHIVLSNQKLKEKKNVCNGHFELPLSLDRSGQTISNSAAWREGQREAEKERRSGRER